MVNLVGTYECKVDAKGRLMVPAPLKKQLVPMLQDGFVLKRSVYENCLELYPLKEWDAVMEEMDGRLNRFLKPHRNLMRRFTAGAKTVDVDTNGRLLIPKDLVEFAGIDKEIVLTSAMNYIEIWDKQKYENTLDDSVDDFAELAEEIMGNQQNNGIS
ncbi:division/cell wall cluster transcriptional repressor MraZ [Salinimicrobium sp. GXAS 041]|uniref:division/cell wall cluster transcriptional repressor MraZ n=1 Tax=Salinimicrobium sp. GXAS 041 TaxID=3400806 RepID=UPI003C7514E3